MQTAYFKFFMFYIQMFLSSLIDVAGHAGKLDAAFEVLREARKHGKHPGTISYSSLMGACSNVCPVCSFINFIVCLLTGAFKKKKKVY